MNGIIDFHTHAFPDALAPAAIPALEQKGNVKAFHDGTVAGLLAAMDQAGVARSVLCSIATKPGQFEPILSWSAAVRTDRLIPFPSVHPADPRALERLARIRAAGFKGLKMHPYYQEFTVDEERMLPFYEAVCREGLILVLHTGFDIGFPRFRCADPVRIRRVVERFPELKLVTTHLGSWDQWAEVRALLTGRPVYMDISFSLQFLDRETARDLILHHPPTHVLFGSDSPWADQAAARSLLENLGLETELEQRILVHNGQALLDSVA